MKHLMELSTYDQIKDLKKRYDIEQKEIDKIEDYKTWKLKNSRASKRFLKQMDELTKKKDSYSLKGDMNAKYLYHYTDVDACYNIISDDEMLSGEGEISFTTHPNLYKRGFVFWYPNRYSKGRHDKNTPVKIKFNFENMKKDGLKFKTGSDSLGTYAGEEEIRYMGYDLTNIIKYIEEVIIISDKIEELSDNYDKLINTLNEKDIKYKII